MLGAVFAGRASGGEIVEGVQAVFLTAAPLAALALLIVLALPETPLQTRDS